ncbi:MAG TPA: helix-hairpin-helix domain-containing protein [Anaerolineales bacterium]|nr:helix-hairpin-helix domain-containing protein [Anaerolineales bacterium]HNH26790.1 helix-hairpin-helix domain-containing protein [Anaerolineales bacterium]
MSRFLDFLNTADLNTLTQVSGVNRQLAGNLIAARPFDAEEDALNVKGMGKATLARLQSFAEAQGNGSESSAMVPVEEEAMPAVMEKNPPAQEDAPKKESFFVRLGRAIRSFFVALLKLIMLAILFVSIGAMFYYGLPYIQRTFIAPVEQNTAQIKTMEAEIETLQTQLDEMNSRVSALEGSVEAHTASIEKLEEMQTALETQLEENQDAVLLELKQEIMFTRALDVLARARLYLAQSNFGLAKTDVQTARDLLAELNAEKEDEVLTKAIERIDLALDNLPDFPVVASGDLEIAWQILVSGNAPASTATATPTLVPTEPATATPTAVDTAATPTLIPSATATP